jgi:tRNA A37 methylthiotransferase MiaB
VVGVLGCMAERLKERLLDADKLADVVVGPDAYRDLPRLVDIVRGPSGSGGDGGSIGSSSSSSSSSSEAGGGGVAGVSSSAATTAMNVQLSLEETYADILPVRPAGATSAFLSIMRGCDNMCAFCIVPFTRCAARLQGARCVCLECGVWGAGGWGLGAGGWGLGAGGWGLGAGG